LDDAAAATFLDSGELRDKVWKSYGDTINAYHIHAIPLFVFNVPSIGMVGGPFREEGARKPFVVNGSSDEESFVEVFSCIHSAIKSSL
jgi:hypothetical protein